MKHVDPKYLILVNFRESSHLYIFQEGQNWRNFVKRSPTVGISGNVLNSTRHVTFDLCTRVYHRYWRLTHQNSTVVHVIHSLIYAKHLWPIYGYTNYLVRYWPMNEEHIYIFQPQILQTFPHSSFGNLGRMVCVPQLWNRNNVLPSTQLCNYQYIHPSSHHYRTWYGNTPFKWLSTGYRTQHSIIGITTITRVVPVVLISRIHRHSIIY